MPEACYDSCYRFYVQFPNRPVLLQSQLPETHPTWASPSNCSVMYNPHVSTMPPHSWGCCAGRAQGVPDLQSINSGESLSQRAHSQGTDCLQQDLSRNCAPYCGSGRTHSGKGKYSTLQHRPVISTGFQEPHFILHK